MKEPPDPQKDDIIQAWIDMTNCDPETPGHEESFWAYMIMSDMVNYDPKGALELVQNIYAKDKSNRVMEALSAGPLEDLLVKHGVQIIDDFERIVKERPEFARLLGGIWKNAMDHNVWKRVQKIRNRRGWDGNPA